MSYEHIWALLGLLLILGWAGLVILARHVRERGRLKVRNMIHQERMRAMEKGVPLGEFPDHLSTENWGDDVWVPHKKNIEWDRKMALGLGLVMTLGGAGMAFWLFRFLDRTVSGDFREIAPAGLILMLMGIGLLLYRYLSRPPKD
jgi:hypothetical protein